MMTKNITENTEWYPYTYQILHGNNHRDLTKICSFCRIIILWLIGNNVEVWVNDRNQHYLSQDEEKEK